MYMYILCENLHITHVLMTLEYYYKLWMKYACKI